MKKLSILLLSILLPLISSQFGGDNRILAVSPDGLSLLAFKSAVIADPSSALSAWTDSDPEPCRWPGIACPAAISDVAAPRVIGVDVVNKNLSGYIPSELGRLLFLRRLVLHGNRLYGPIPAAIFRLPRLRLLDLSRNHLSGSLPRDLRECRRLRRLDLSENRLSGEIPAGIWLGMASLEVLDLSSNRFNGSLPADLESIAGTLTLNLSYNRFSGDTLRFNNISATRTSPPSPAERKKNKKKHKKGIGAWEITLIAAADAAGVTMVGVAAICVYWRWKRRDKEKGSSSSTSEEEEEEEGRNEGVLVAIDGEGFEVELEELFGSSAYVLGRGGGKGIVYKVVVGNGMQVAVRRIGGVGGGGGRRRRKEFAAEAKAIAKVKHRNVVRLRAYYWAREEKLLITDFVSNGNLATALRGRSGQPTLSWSIRLKIAKGSARGLAHIHDCSPRKFVHGDVNPSNILLDGDYNPYIADLGLNHLIDIAGNSDAATPSAVTTGLIALPYIKSGPLRRPNNYWAPELYPTGTRPTQKSDVYSFGVVLLQLATGKSPQLSSPMPTSSPSGDHEPEIVKWVRKGFNASNPLSEMVEPAILREARAEKDVILVLHVALACTRADPNERPRFKAVSDKLGKIRT